MSVLRTVIVVLLAAAVSAGLTGWVIAMRQSSDRLNGSYYQEPAAPAVPVGDTAGTAKVPAPAFDENPLADDPTAVAEGHKLFLSMNCAGCHGYGAKGGMGPNLTDSYWRYGGTPALIYKSILDGRPQGMPEWGVSLPRRSIWQLVAYIQSLGGTVPANMAAAVNSGDQTDRGQNKGANDQQ